MIVKYITYYHYVILLCEQWNNIQKSGLKMYVRTNNVPHAGINLANNSWDIIYSITSYNIKVIFSKDIDLIFIFSNLCEIETECENKYENFS